MHRWLLWGIVALGLAATTSLSAQPLTEGTVASSIRAADALAARIRAYHRGPGAWTGLTPVPASYCPTMLEGEAVIKELARLASRAILYRLPGLALSLQHVGDRLSDELDVEEAINQHAGIPYNVFPCPAPPGVYPARAPMLRIVDALQPRCRIEANAVRVSFEARRTLMQQCLRIPGT